jgi:uncharacterized protein
MLRIVIDTNVLVSAIIRPGSAPSAILRRWQTGRFLLVTCQQALSELDKVLQRPHIVQRYHISDAKREQLLLLLREHVILVPGTSVTDIIPADPTDEVFVSTAVEGDAKYIVSGDRHLLNLRRYGLVRILTAARFLAVLDRCSRIFGA